MPMASSVKRRNAISFPSGDHVAQQSLWLLVSRSGFSPPTMVV